MKDIIKEIRERTLSVLDVTKKEIEKGLELHRKIIVCDSLLACDPIPRSKRLEAKINELLDKDFPVYDIFRLSIIDEIIMDEMLKNSEVRKEYVDAWKLSGVTCASQTMPRSGVFTLSDVWKSLSIFHSKLNLFKDVLIKATCADDIRKAKEEGKHAIIWNIQNLPSNWGGVDLECELETLDILYGFGLRIVQLTYQFRNMVGDGCAERYESGISYFGEKVIEKLNRLGVLIDVSHCGYKTTLDAVELSKDPIAATHTTCRTVYDHPRGKRDDELQAIAEKGGYIGICAVPAFLGGSGTLKEWLNHVDYAVNLVGIDHVGIGTDCGYERIPQRLIETMEKKGKDPKGAHWWSGFWPIKIETPPQVKKDETISGSLAWINLPYFTVGLVSRGYSDNEIKKIMGENFLRIIERVIG